MLQNNSVTLRYGSNLESIENSSLILLRKLLQEVNKITNKINITVQEANIICNKQLQVVCDVTQINKHLSASKQELIFPHKGRGKSFFDTHGKSRYNSYYICVTFTQKASKVIQEMSWWR